MRGNFGRLPYKVVAKCKPKEESQSGSGTDFFRKKTAPQFGANSETVISLTHETVIAPGAT